MPTDVLEEYEKEIEKAREIISFLEYVQDNGLSFNDIVGFLLETHKGHFLNYSASLINLYFDNQTLITNSFFSNVTSRVEDVNQDV